MREAMTNSFDQYREQVRMHRATGSSELIYNSSPDHAAVLIEELFYSATERAGILTMGLAEEVYALPSVINAAQAFLENDGAKLTIVTEKRLSVDHPFLVETAGNQRYAEKVVIHFVSQDEAPPFNFMVADWSAYRFEEDKSSASAVACFNGRTMANQMQDLMEAYADQLPADGWLQTVAA